MLWVPWKQLQPMIKRIIQRWYALRYSYWSYILFICFHLDLQHVTSHQYQHDKSFSAAHWWQCCIQQPMPYKWQTGLSYKVMDGLRSSRFFYEGQRSHSLDQLLKTRAQTNSWWWWWFEQWGGYDGGRELLQYRNETVIILLIIDDKK